MLPLAPSIKVFDSSCRDVTFAQGSKKANHAVLDYSFSFSNICSAAGERFSARSADTASIESMPSSYLRHPRPSVQVVICDTRKVNTLTHLPSLGPSTLIPTVLTFVLIISICFSLKSPELVKVKSEKGIRTSCQS